MIKCLLTELGRPGKYLALGHLRLVLTTSPRAKYFPVLPSHSVNNTIQRWSFINIVKTLCYHVPRIGHDNKGGFAGWFLDKVIINVPSLGQHAVFPCGRWLDKSKDDGKLERELSPAEDSTQVYKPRMFVYNMM